MSRNSSSLQPLGGVIPSPGMLNTGYVASLPSPAPSDEGRCTCSEVPSSSHTNHQRQANNQMPGSARKRASAVAFGGSEAQANSAAPQSQPQGFDWRSLVHNVLTSTFLYKQQAQQCSSEEEWRLNNLTKAAHWGDTFYIVFHQLVCLHVWDLSGFAAVVKCGPKMRKGFRVAAAILDPCGTTSDEFFGHWSTFPASLANMANDPTYKLLIPHVMSCMDALADGCEDLQIDCSRQNLPPVAEDLQSRLLITSAVLQVVMFGKVLRTLWPRLSPDQVAEAQTVFAEDQAHINLPKAQRNSLKINERLRTRYRLILQGKVPESRLWSFVPQQAPPQRTAPQAVPPGQLTYGPVQLQSNTQMRPVPPVHEPTSESVQTPSGTMAQLRRPLQQQPQISVLRLQPTPTRPVHPGTQMPPQQTPNRPLQRRMIPAPGDKAPQPAPPDPNKYAIHQSHLRSPKLKCVMPSPTTQSRMYLYVSKFLRAPELLDLNSGEFVQEFKFELSDHDFSKHAQDTRDQTFGVATRTLNPDTLMYRLRCVEGTKPDSLSGWLVRDTAWPSCTIFKINGHRLEPRLKQHYGRNLPIDLTPVLKPRENTLRTYTHATTTGPKPPIHTFAVETVSLASREQIFKDVNMRVYPAEKTIASIVQSIKPSSLASASQSGDDDLQCLTTTIPINLTDPILGTSVWRVPVRAATCRHREAFDLTAFLDTRRHPQAPPDEPSGADAWFCPICGADARPEVLAVDEFLARIGRILTNQGIIDRVRVIDVDEHGMWDARNERSSTAAGSRGASMNRENNAAGNETKVSASGPTSEPRERSKLIETIELE